MAKVDKKGLSGIVDQEVRCDCQGYTSSRCNSSVTSYILLQINDPVEYPNPLLEPVEEIHGKLYIQGNRALINLNLSGKISSAGFREKLI